MGARTSTTRNIGLQFDKPPEYFILPRLYAVHRPVRTCRAHLKPKRYERPSRPFTYNDQLALEATWPIYHDLIDAYASRTHIATTRDQQTPHHATGGQEQRCLGRTPSCTPPRRSAQKSHVASA